MSHTVRLSHSVRMILSSLLMSATGCVFDGSGFTTQSTTTDPDTQRPPSFRDGTPDDFALEAAAVDLATDLESTDQLAPVLVSASRLGSALLAEHVDCSEVGQPSAGKVPLADDNRVELYAGLPTAADQPVDSLITWAGTQPTVVVVWNLNTCGDESPYADVTEWGSAALFVRGATLVDGALRLLPGTTRADINLIDVDWDNTYQVDIEGPTDAGLAAYPQILQVVDAVKLLLLQLGGIGR